MNNIINNNNANVIYATTIDELEIPLIIKIFEIVSTIFSAIAQYFIQAITLGTLLATKEIEIIYTVITRLELGKLTTEIEKIEPTAFVVMNSVKDTKGGMIKKRPLKH